MGRLGAAARALLPKQPLARGISILVGGSAGSQILLLFGAPVLTRLFSPADFGQLAVYSGVLSLFAVIAGFRYELAIPLPVDDDDAANIVALALFVVTGVALACGVVAGVWGESLAPRIGLAGVANHWWLLPCGVLFLGYFQVFNYWGLRRKNFSVLARTKLLQTLLTLVVQVAWYKVGGLALLFGQVFGQGAACFLLGGSVPRALKRVRVRGVVAAAIRYRRFPLYSTWAALFNVAGGQLPALMLAAFFGPPAAGLYALARRVLAAPMTTIGTAVGQGFVSDAALARREGRLIPLITAVHERLAQVALPPMLVLVFAAPEVFALIFGENWREAGLFAQWMVPWLYLVFVTSPLSSLLEIAEKQRQHLLFQLVLLLTRVGTIVIGAFTNDLSLTIALFSMGSAVCWAWLLLWLFKTFQIPLHSLAKASGCLIGWSLICVSPLILSVMTSSDSMINYAVGSSCLLIILRYMALLARARNI